MRESAESSWYTGLIYNTNFHIPASFITAKCADLNIINELMYVSFSYADCTVLHCLAKLQVVFISLHTGLLVNHTNKCQESMKWVKIMPEIQNT